MSPSLAFASGLLGGYFDQIQKERDRKEKNALDAAHFLLQTGRVRDPNDLLPFLSPLLDQGSPLGSVRKGKAGAGSQGGKGGQDPFSILSAFIKPTLGQGQSGSSPSPTGSPGATSGSLPPSPGAAPPQSRGPLMGDDEMLQRRVHEEQTLGRAQEQFRTEQEERTFQTWLKRFTERGFPPDRAALMAGEIAGNRSLTSAVRQTQPKFGPTVSVDSLTGTEKAQDGQPFKEVYPNAKAAKYTTEVTPEGETKEYYVPSDPTPSQAARTNLPPRLKEAVDEELAAKGIDPRTATDAQKNGALSAAGKRLIAKGALDAEAEQALIKARTLAGQGGLAAQAGLTGPQGEELPQVSIGPDGRPDPASQQELLGHFDRLTQTLIKGLTDYTINPNAFAQWSSRFRQGTGTPTRGQMLGYAKMYDPSYDEKLYAARGKVQSDWAAGKTRDSMVATNTVVRHLDELYRATQALAPFTLSKLPGLNEYKLKGQRQFNAKVRDAIRQFEVARQAVAAELERVYRGTGGSQADIAQWQQNISPYNATDDKVAAIQEAVNLMFGRLKAATDSYHAGMGKAPPPGLGITLDSLNVLRKMGVDISGLPEEGRQPDGAGAGAGAGTEPPSDPLRNEAVDYLRKNNLPIDERNIQHYLQSRKPAA